MLPATTSVSRTAERHLHERRQRGEAARMACASGAGARTRAAGRARGTGAGRAGVVVAAASCSLPVARPGCPAAGPCRAPARDQHAARAACRYERPPARSLCLALRPGKAGITAVIPAALALCQA